MRIDRDMLTSMFKQGLPEGARLVLEILDGADLNEEGVLETIYHMAAGPNDTIVFVYSGHGTTKDNRHLLTFSNGERVFRSRIYDEIARKRPRLAVLLTDCCAGNDDTEKRIVHRPVPADAWRKETLRDLFLRSTGVVDINACRPGLTALGSNSMGGLLINALAEGATCDAEHVEVHRPDGFVSWGEFTEYLARKTEYYTGVTDHGELVRISEDVQAATPMARHKPDSPPAWRTGMEVCTHWSGTGVMVRSVEANSPAAAAGIRELDEIVSIDGRPIKNTWNDFRRAIRDAEGEVELVIDRITGVTERVVDAPWERVVVTVDVVSDTVPRRFRDGGSHAPLFDVKNYFHRRYLEHLQQLAGGNRLTAASYDQATLDDLRKFAWLCMQCPKARVWTSTPEPVIQKPSLSVEACRTACERTKWSDPAWITRLAVAYSSNRQFAEAITTQQKACEMSSTDDRTEMERRLRLYRGGNRFSEPF